jgi:hypothetical protein
VRYLLRVAGRVRRQNREPVFLRRWYLVLAPAGPGGPGGGAGTLAGVPAAPGALGAVTAAGVGDASSSGFLLQPEIRTREIQTIPTVATVGRLIIG